MAGAPHSQCRLADSDLRGPDSERVRAKPCLERLGVPGPSALRVHAARACTSCACPDSPSVGSEPNPGRFRWSTRLLDAYSYGSEDQRREALAVRVNHDNYHRAHTSCREAPAASLAPDRVNNVMPSYITLARHSNPVVRLSPAASADADTLYRLARVGAEVKPGRRYACRDEASAQGGHHGSIVCA